MTTLPIPVPHRITITKRGGDRPWCAVCACGRWGWRSRFQPMCLRQGIGHLINQARKAA